MKRLEAVSVSRRYGRARVVDGASLTLEPGKITALLGGSGAGKSTLLRLIAGLEPVDEGEVRLGEDVLSTPARTIPAEKRRIGLIFQDFALFPHLTALENTMFGLAGIEKAAAREKASAWLDRLGLSHRRDAYPQALSGGEQQRVSIARALAPEPVAILMDEPFSGLDPALRESVRDETAAIVREAGMPALIVTHDAREAMLAADKLAVMRAGRIVQTGAPDEVYARPVDAETAAALGPVNRMTGVVSANGTVETPFGAVSAGGLEPGQSALIILREEAFRIAAEGAHVQIERAARTGPFVRALLRSGEARAYGLFPATEFPGATVEACIAIDPAGAFVFPDTTS